LPGRDPRAAGRYRALVVETGGERLGGVRLWSTAKLIAAIATKMIATAEAQAMPGGWRFCSDDQRDNDAPGFIPTYTDAAVLKTYTLDSLDLSPGPGFRMAAIRTANAFPAAEGPTLPLFRPATLFPKIAAS
jgi:hypothetical protein